MLRMNLNVFAKSDSLHVSFCQINLNYSLLVKINGMHGKMGYYIQV